jgi:hypothetical protein
MPSLPTGPDVLDYDNPQWSRQLLLHLRNNIPKVIHHQLAQVSREFINNQLGAALPDCEGMAEKALEMLRRDGFCPLGNLLSAQQLSDIHAYFKPLPLHNPWEENGPTYSRGSVPPAVNVAEFTADAIARAPHLLALTLGPRVLPLVSHYLGVPPTIPYLSSWWSLHGRSQARDAQLFHVDSHDFKWLKLFVYLTDVDATSGPHILVRGSHDHDSRSRRFQDLHQRDPETAKALMTSSTKGERFQDDHIEALYGPTDIIAITGRAGEAFLVDTAAIHKGLPPQTEDRLIFQALYTMIPTVKDHVSPITLPGAYASHARHAGASALSPKVWRYCNRLILRDPEIDTV